jgi:hypothetical protein
MISSSEQSLDVLLGHVDDVSVTISAPHRVLLFVLGILSTIEDPSGIVGDILASPIAIACQKLDQEGAASDATKRSAR